MQIEGKEIDILIHYFDKVTYVPGHANGNAGHTDCEQGVIVGLTDNEVRVLYCTGRTVQLTNPEDLVWG